METSQELTAEFDLMDRCPNDVARIGTSNEESRRGNSSDVSQAGDGHETIIGAPTCFLNHDDFTVQMGTRVYVQFVLLNGEMRKASIIRDFKWDRDLYSLLSELSWCFGRIVKLDELPFKGDAIFQEGQTVRAKNRLGSSRRHEEEEDSESDEREIKEASAELVRQQFEEDLGIRFLANHGVDDCEEQFLSEDSVNSSDGYQRKRGIPRNIMINASDDLADIWAQVEKKLGIPRSHYALVSGSRYLLESGIWPSRLQWVEIRFRGLGAGPHPKCNYMQLPLDLGFQRIDIESEEEEESEACLGKDLEQKLTTRFQDDVKLFRHIDGCRKAVDRERKIYGGQIYAYRRESIFRMDEDRDVIVAMAKVTPVEDGLI
jgi:hypothetical protein